MPEVVWGDVPGWLTAIGTLGALVFAVIAVVNTKKTFDIEHARDVALADAKSEQDAYVRRSQAALVSAWWGKSRTEVDGPPGVDSSWGVFLRNSSEAPIYKAQMTVRHANAEHGPAAAHLSVVPPDPSAGFIPIQVPAHDFDGRGHDQLAEYRVSLRFTDAGGVRWIRDEYGALKQLDPRLAIWTSPEIARGLAPFTSEFLATYGVTPSFDTSLIESELERHFLEASDDPGAECPDIIVGVHDWIGNLVMHDAIEPIVLTEGYRVEFQDPRWTLDALSFEGRVYGVPSSLDTVALFRNLDLAPCLPESIEQLLEVGNSLVAAGVVDDVLSVSVGPSGDPFLVWPLISSAGGWLFGRRDDGSWDSSVLGVNSPETIAAFEKIRTLGALGILRSNVDGARAMETFLAGETAFLLATSGAVSLARARGIRFAVSAVPPFAGCAVPHPFVAVYGFFIARNGRNRLIAADLAPDYLSRPEVVEQFGKSLHVVPRRVLPAMDPAIAALHQLCCEGVPMPSFAEMRDVWSLLGEAELKLIRGEEPGLVASRLETDIAALFA